MGDKRSGRSNHGDVINVAAACADFRNGRRAPVNVANVIAGLDCNRGDLPLAAVSELQHGLALSGQLRAIGLGASAISHRCREGRLFRVHRGVYLVGRRTLTPRGAMLAAVLAAGPGAVLSHRSALQLWCVLPVSVGPHEITAARLRRSRDGYTAHRSSTLTPDDLAAIDNIPLTAPARALLDFAVGADPGELETAVNEARVHRLLRPNDLERLRARTKGHHGWGPLNRLLDAEREPDFSRREAERRLLRLVREARLPEPRRNIVIHGYEVDLYWPERELVVEVDSYAFHGNRRAFEQDRRKQAELIDRGLEVLRFTWLQITREQLWLIARIAGRLAARAGAG
jgi:very-short-patch-repair endonuclease